MWRTTRVLLVERHVEQFERHAGETWHFRKKTSIFHCPVELCTELSTGVDRTENAPVAEQPARCSELKGKV